MPPEIFRPQWKLRYAGRLHGWSNQNCLCGYPRGCAVGGFLLDRSHRGWTLSSALDGSTADGKGPVGRTPVARLQAGPQHWGYGGLNWRGIFTDWEDTDIGLPMHTKNCRNSPLWILPYFLSVMLVAIFIKHPKYPLSLFSHVWKAHIHFQIMSFHIFTDTMVVLRLLSIF